MHGDGAGGGRHFDRRANRRQRMVAAGLVVLGLIAAIVVIRRRGGRVAYLDVWARAVSELEDPGLADVALGCTDTSSRH